MFRRHQPLPRPDLPPTTIPSPSSPDPCARRLPRPRRGGSAFGSFCPADPIPFRIRTYEKTAHNPFRIRTSKTQDLKPFRIRTYEKPPGGVGRDSHSWLSSSMPLQATCKGHGTPVTPSLRVSANSAPLRYPFPLLAPQLSIVDCRPLPSDQSRITSHRFQNFYPPASDLRHNPAAQGQRPHSSSQTGRIR